MKTLARKTWQRIVALFLVVVSLFGLLNLPPIDRAFAADEYAGTGTFTQCTGELMSGYYVFGGGSATSVSAINNTVGTSWIKFTTTSTSGTIMNPDSSIVWYYDATAGTFKNGDNYIYWPTTGNAGGVGTENTPVTVTETATAGVYNITVKDTPERMLRLNGTSGYRFYTSSTGTNTFYFFKMEATTCEHTYTEEITTAATCTTDGVKTFTCSKCSDSYTEVILAGHEYVNGVCSVCQLSTLTVNRDSFGEASGYAWHAWTATATTGETISGSGFIYGKTKDSVQMNPAQGGDYIYNATALPGAITSVTLTQKSGTSTRYFDVLTSTSPFSKDVKDSLESEVTDAKKEVTTEGVTWTFETNHKYFAIVITGGASSLTSIEITYKVCPHTNKVAIGEAKDATCTEDGITAGEKCADCDEIFTAQETIDATGHTDVNPADSKCDTCGANLCTEHVWVDGEVITEPTCTATGLQAQVCENCGERGEDKEVEMIPHTEATDEAVAATCTETGLTEGSHCSVCDTVIVEQTVVEMVAHNYTDGVCSVCGDIKLEGTQLTEFQFGDNGEATHKDGSAIKDGEEYTDGEYTLALTNATKVYGNAFDAKGNSALKLGTDSVAASFTFTVYDSVNTVVIYIAGYKVNAAKIEVNGTGYTITSHSNDGDYTKVVVDTSENKTVTLTTLSGGYRAMIDSIEFWGEDVVVPDIQANVVLKSNLAIQFAVENVDGITEVRINDSVVAPSGTKDDTYNVYAYRDIEPQKIGDAVVLTAYRGETCIATLDYNVKDYCDQIINGDYSEELKNLCKAILDYGAAAQNVEGYKTDALVNEGVVDKVADAEMDANDYDEVACEGATVVVDQVALTLTDSITMKYMLTGCEAGMTAKIYFGETEVDSLQITADGTCVVSYAFAGAEDFGKVVTIKVFNENNEQVSNAVSYSVKSYCVDLAATSDDDYKKLAQAIYNYVTYIDAYVAPQA